jgi:hypothetical protein
MPQVGFKLTIPVFERPKAVLALVCAATGTGSEKINCQIIIVHLSLPFSKERENEREYKEVMKN